MPLWCLIRAAAALALLWCRASAVDTSESAENLGPCSGTGASSSRSLPCSWLLLPLLLSASSVSGASLTLSLLLAAICAEAGAGVLLLGLDWCWLPSGAALVTCCAGLG